MGYQNFYSSKISNDIGAGDNTITVDNAPASTSGRMVLEARNPTQREIIKYTSVSGNILQGVTRGQGGTSAKSHLKGALIQQNATAEDLQDLYDAFASFSAANNDWRTLVATLNSVTYNGNRSYDLVFNGTDLTGTLSPGMRLRTTRTVAAPTQCTSLNGTTQYYSKSSPVGTTFTDDFVAGGWVKLSSYPATYGNIISRFNGTSGWCLDVDASGRLRLVGFNGGVGNHSLVQSIQSLPLNRWVYVSAQLDMSAFTATSTTSYIMFDGFNVPAGLSRQGTNPIFLVQAGNLEVGSQNGGLQPFPGKIAQAFYTSAKVTQTNINLLSGQGLTPALITANNIVSAYSFDNNINDLNTTNANNLTANGSAVATNADSPFGTQASGLISSTLDYAIIQSVSFSTDTTVVVQVPEGCTIPTSGGVSAVGYSGVFAPYGFPQKNAGKVTAILQNNQTGISSLAQVNGLSVTIQAVAGREYRITAQGRSGIATGGAGYIIFAICAGAVSAANVISSSQPMGTANGVTVPLAATAIYTAPSTGLLTFNVGMSITSNTVSLEAASQYPAFLIVEPV